MKNKLLNIKTNIITGFLGVGKTSAVLHLMAQKPEAEKWSVLVNEFGDIGIDGAIYKSQGVAVKEIPGGCMCCAAGVPLQVAVNQVLKQTRPDRLLIEPSGLGHPKRVLDTLRGEYFKDVLDIRSVVCLIDPRHLLDTRYTTHENFIDQITLADIIVANKIDLCDDVSLKAFDDYVDQLVPSKQEVIKTQGGTLDLKVLEGESNSLLKAIYPEHHTLAAPLNGTSLENALNQNDGFSSLGIRLDNKIFNFNKLDALFQSYLSDADLRIKAILKTDKGWQIFNCANQAMNVISIKYSDDSRIELITRAGQLPEGNALHERLQNCLIQGAFD